MAIIDYNVSPATLSRGYGDIPSIETQREEHAKDVEKTIRIPLSHGFRSMDLNSKERTLLERARITRLDTRAGEDFLTVEFDTHPPEATPLVAKALSQTEALQQLGVDSVKSTDLSVPALYPIAPLLPRAK